MLVAPATAPAAAGASNATVTASTATASAATTSTPLSPGGADAVAPADDAAVVAAYPNPVVDGDVGEYVLLRFPEPTAVGNWTLSDGETTVGFPNRTLSGRVLVAANVSAARSLLANHSIGDASGGPGNDSATTAAAGAVAAVEAPGLALANGGETLSLATPDGRVVGELAYADAPEGERYRDGAFHALGETDHPPRTTRDVRTRTFVTPDSAVPLAPIERADDRVYLAGYTFASERVARALERAAARGVDVQVLLDDAPVGGVTRRQVRVLDALDGTDVEIRALGGSRARYDYHHAKYLVADDAAVVLTENFKPSGTGGHANRGWGVVLDDAQTAGDLATVFQSDWRVPDARPWSTVDPDPDGDDQEEPPANGSYPTRIESANVTADAVTVVVAPDNAERTYTARLRNATDRVRVLQMSAERDGVLLREAIAAARRGVDVDVLLSSAWYAREENGRVVDSLNALAEREDLPLAARLVDPGGRFRKVHAKGVVVDDAVVLGSVNWNDHSLRENREVAVVLEGDAVATYYADAFRADWTGGPDPRVPRWLAALTALAVLALLVVLARRVDFDPRT
nr:phospholipase D-like domain-containing protein [Halorubellus sp. JP-L1]